MKTIKEIMERTEEMKWWKATRIDGSPITWGIVAVVILFILATGWWIAG